MAPYQDFEMTTKAPSTPSRLPRLLRPIGFGLLVVIIVFFGFQLVRFIIEKTRKSEETIVASVGKVISDFPQDLVLEPQAVVGESYSIHYNDQGISQPVLSYGSKKTMPENVAMFRNYFSKNNWTILHDANPLDRYTYFYAMKDKYKNEANVTMQQVGTQVQITISYVAR